MTRHAIEQNDRICRKDEFTVCLLLFCGSLLMMTFELDRATRIGHCLLVLLQLTMTNHLRQFRFDRSSSASKEQILDTFDAPATNRWHAEE